MHAKGLLHEPGARPFSPAITEPLGHCKVEKILPRRWTLTPEQMDGPSSAAMDTRELIVLEDWDGKQNGARRSFCEMLFRRCLTFEFLLETSEVVSCARRARAQIYPYDRVHLCSPHCRSSGRRRSRSKAMARSSVTSKEGQDKFLFSTFVSSARDSNRRPWPISGLNVSK